MNNNLAFLFWILFLCSIVIPAAVIVNYNLGDSQLQIDLATYLANH
jgi:hypothetical protein